jgi:hypothetical protein
VSSSSRAFFLFFPCNQIINIKKKSFSGEAKDSVIFPFYFLLHKRAKPIHPPYIHPSAHLSTHTSTLLPCFANAKPLPEAGNKNYLGSECDHLPEAGNIYIGTHPMRSAHPYLLLFIVGAAEGGERRQTNTPKAY